MESLKLLCLCWHNSSHSLIRYSVSCCVFLGTADTLASAISCCVFDAIKCLLLLVVAGVEVGLISRHGGSNLFMTGSDCCCRCSNDSIAARRMRLISLWWSVSLLLLSYRVAQKVDEILSLVVITQCAHARRG